jgi:hypothetical protein
MSKFRRWLDRTLCSHEWQEILPDFERHKRYRSQNWMFPAPFTTYRCVHCGLIIECDAREVPAPSLSMMKRHF